MPKKMNDLEELEGQIAHLALEMNKLLTTKIRKRHTEIPLDSSVVRSQVSMFLRHFISYLLIQSLEAKPSGKYTKRELIDFVEKNFRQMKYDIQNEVATGFSIAQLVWLGDNIDYYCTVNLLPDPVNKEMC